VKFSPLKLKALVEADPRLSKDIAGEAGFSAGSLSHWTLGKRVPGADELAALAKVFNVPLDYFFEGPGLKSAGRKARPARETAQGRALDQAMAQADALLERAHSLKTALEKLRSGSSSNKTATQAGAEAVAIAKDFANQLGHRSR
jgi:transcriptional regulator with XRE-family HTH domain